MVDKDEISGYSKNVASPATRLLVQSVLSGELVADRF